MNRKHFLGNTGWLLTAPVWPSLTHSSAPSIIIPPYLSPGDTIGITSPAGWITLEEMRPAMEQMQAWGFRLKVGSSIGKRDFTRGGTDAERLADLQSMLDDHSLSAIMCARGGYGSIRIVDQISWQSFLRHPKWIIGFSDITVLHSHIHRQCRVATIHSKMTNSFPEDPAKAEPVQNQTIVSIFEALSGEKMKYKVPPAYGNCQGSGTGELVGGNLKTLETLAGTASDIQTDGKILFVEDTGEYLYSVDRMFWNLRRTGKLDKLKGLIIGGFKMKPDDPGDEFGKTLQEIVLEKIKGYDYPVCFDFPVGHQRANFALKCGVRHTLVVNEAGASLEEIRS